MARKYTSSINVTPFNVGSAQPIDVRMVVEFIDDLKPAALLKTTYIGMVVYVLEDSSLYVCHSKPPRATQSLSDVEDGWRKIDVDYSVRIVESESDLTDGTTIMFPYQGMMVYVTSNSSLYVLLTKGSENSKDINNWRKISVTPSTILDKAINPTILIVENLSLNLSTESAKVEKSIFLDASVSAVKFLAELSKFKDCLSFWSVVNDSLTFFSN